jgi:putative membrane protein insertion efficiency factor
MILFLIGIYQKIAPSQLRESCRFEPSCSNYMIQAIQKYGTFKGTMMGLRRINRCRYPNGGTDFP